MLRYVFHNCSHLVIMVTLFTCHIFRARHNMVDLFPVTFTNDALRRVVINYYALMTLYLCFLLSAVFSLMLTISLPGQKHR